MTTKSKTTKAQGVIASAVDAAEELGHAAESLKDSWSHVEQAKKKGARFTHAATRAGKKAAKAVSKSAKATYRGAKRAVTRRK
jgi:hypothetical protein